MVAPSQRTRRGGTRSGSTSGAAIRVEGLAEFRRELRKLFDSRVGKPHAPRLALLHQLQKRSSRFAQRYGRIGRVLDFRPEE